MGDNPIMKALGLASIATFLELSDFGTVSSGAFRDTMRGQT